jgi:hypothetical protein
VTKNVTCSRHRQAARSLGQRFRTKTADGIWARHTGPTAADDARRAPDLARCVRENLALALRHNSAPERVQLAHDRTRRLEEVLGKTSGTVPVVSGEKS